jgi:hypothetical protein
VVRAWLGDKIINYFNSQAEPRPLKVVQTALSNKYESQAAKSVLAQVESEMLQGRLG